jgi:hypothetical protein
MGSYTRAWPPPRRRELIASASRPMRRASPSAPKGARLSHGCPNGSWWCPNGTWSSSTGSGLNTGIAGSRRPPRGWIGRANPTPNPREACVQAQSGRGGSSVRPLSTPSTGRNPCVKRDPADKGQVSLLGSRKRDAGCLRLFAHRQGGIVEGASWWWDRSLRGSIPGRPCAGGGTSRHRRRSRRAWSEAGRERLYYVKIEGRAIYGSSGVRSTTGIRRVVRSW